MNKIKTNSRAATITLKICNLQLQNRVDLSRCELVF